MGQTTYETGDNSTLIGCSSHCSADDRTTECIDTTTDYFQRSFLSQLRYLLSVMVTKDQWVRRNGREEGLTLEEITESVREGLLIAKGEKEEDVVDELLLENLALLLGNRTKEFSDRIISRPPRFRCPIGCEVKCNMTENALIASIIVNITIFVAAVSVIMHIRHQVSVHQDHIRLATS